MLAQRKPKPGQPGTKKLLEEYGSRLLCVRYRCDPESQSDINTVAILVEESEYKPQQCRHKTDQFVTLRIGWKEYTLQRHVNQAEATWDQTARLWKLCHTRMVTPGLKDRIVTSKVTISNNPKVPTNRNVQVTTYGNKLLLIVTCFRM